MREEWGRFESRISDGCDDLEDVCGEGFGECNEFLEVSLDVLFEERHPYMRLVCCLVRVLVVSFHLFIGCLPLCIRQEVP